MSSAVRGHGAVRPGSDTVTAWSSALAATAVVVLVVLLARPDGGAAPGPPEGIRPVPAPLDEGGRSLDRCALAVEFAGRAAHYPERARWRPLARLATGEVFVTMLAGEVPFVCVTDARTVAVSDPASAAPLDTALLLLSTPEGVLAAAAPPGGSVAVGAVGRPRPAAARYFLAVTGTAISARAELEATIRYPTGEHRLRSPPRLAPPALRLVDRPWQPSAPSRGTTDLLRRCEAAAGPDPVPRRWQTAHLLSYGSRDQPASLLIALDTGTIGGCSIAPDRVTPLRVWRVGTIGDGPRPFVWLPRPGRPLPDIAEDIAAGPVQPAVARMQIGTDGGRPWEASVAGGTFATRIPEGLTRDPRQLTVRAYDRDGRLVYQGAAAS